MKDALRVLEDLLDAMNQACTLTRLSRLSPEVAEVPTPQPAVGEVLVKVQASSVNRFDLSVAAGYASSG